MQASTLTAVVSRFHDPSIGPKFLHVSQEDLYSAVQQASRASFGSDVEVQVLSTGKSRARMFSVDVHALTVDVPELGGRLTPRLWVRNANDGKTALSVGGGFFHWVCSNGLYIGVADMVAKVRHIDTPNVHGVLDALPRRIAAAADRIATGDLLTVALDAVDTPVLEPIWLVGNLPEVSSTVKQLAIDAIINKTYREKDQPTNAWGLYNLVNELQRRRSRSALVAATKDLGLLENVLVLAEDQRAAA